MKAFSFTLTMVLWGYIIAVLYARYVTPFVQGIRRSLSEGEAAPDLYGGAVTGKVLRVAADFMFFLVQSYFLMGWSAYAILKIRIMTHTPGVSHPAVFYILGMGICQWTLSYIAVKERFQGILSILHSVMGMGACITFAFRPGDIPVLYGWMVNLMGGLR